MSWTEWRDAPPGDFAVLGDPVKHSRSPRMHTAAYKALGRSWRYNAVRVPLSEFDEAVVHLARLGYRGVNCTVPLKEAAFRWAGEVDATTRRIGAANTLRLADRHATNTDAPAFVNTFAGEGPVLVLGAGGTARAVLVALDEAGVRTFLWNRTRAKAEALVESLRVAADVIEGPHLAGMRSVVNTTSASLQGEALPIDWSMAGAGTLVYEAAYGPSPFLDAARAHGLEAVDGLPLLVEQGALAITWWTGVEPDRSVMMEAVR